ncbi:MAG TPA: hypothetical protein VF190_11955, partial [Rhodothermales bacterium]
MAQSLATDHPTSAELPTDRVRPEQAEATYFVPAWGDGFFAVNEAGHVAVRPILGSELAIDIFSVASQLR